jgi:hypothetical protein
VDRNIILESVDKLLRLAEDIISHLPSNLNRYNRLFVRVAVRQKQSLTKILKDDDEDDVSHLI